jgi:hypothetical protein
MLGNRVYTSELIGTTACLQANEKGGPLKAAFFNIPTT